MSNYILFIFRKSLFDIVQFYDGNLIHLVEFVTFVIFDDRCYLYFDGVMSIRNEFVDSISWFSIAKKKFSAQNRDTQRWNYLRDVLLNMGLIEIEDSLKRRVRRLF